MSIPLLIVNTYEQELKSFRTLLKDEGYTIFTAENTKKAMEIITQNSIHVLICDVGILHNDNPQFLENLKHSHPNMIRLITGNDVDESIVVYNINHGNALHCVSKLQHQQSLEKVIAQVLDTDKLLISSHMMRFLNGLDELPTIKPVYTKINEMIENDANISDIAKVIEQDPAITIKILRLGNSALFGLKTASVQKALAYLGFRNIKKLILSTAVFDSLEVNSAVIPVANQLWMHAMHTDTLTKRIYDKYLRLPVPEISSSAGLLHNVGSILFLKYHAKECLALRKQSEDDGQNLLHLEAKTFGLTHEEAGGYLLKWWGLPYPLIETALYHHYPFAKHISDKQLLCVVHIAQHYATKLTSQKDFTDFEGDAFNYLEIRKDDFEKDTNTLTPELLTSF